MSSADKGLFHPAGIQECLCSVQASPRFLRISSTLLMGFLLSYRLAGINKPSRFCSWAIGVPGTSGCEGGAGVPGGPSSGSGLVCAAPPESSGRVACSLAGNTIDV